MKEKVIIGSIIGVVAIAAIIIGILYGFGLLAIVNPTLDISDWTVVSYKDEIDTTGNYFCAVQPVEGEDSNVLVGTNDGVLLRTDQIYKVTGSTYLQRNIATAYAEFTRETVLGEYNGPETEDDVYVVDDYTTKLNADDFVVIKNSKQCTHTTSTGTILYCREHITDIKVCVADSHTSAGRVFQNVFNSQDYDIGDTSEGGYSSGIIDDLTNDDGVIEEDTQTVLWLGGVLIFVIIVGTIALIILKK